MTPAEATWPGPNGMISYVGGVGGISPDHQVYVINPDGSGRHRLTDVGGNGIFHPEWSPDGNRLLGVGTGGLRSTRHDGGPQRRRHGPHPGLDRGGQGVWSRDGSKLVYVTPIGPVGPSSGFEQVVTMAPNGTGRTQLTTIPTYKWIARWSPTDDKIAFGSSHHTSSPGPGRLIRRDLRHRRRRHRSGQGRRRQGYVDQLDWSPDGTRIAFIAQAVQPRRTCARISAARLRRRLRRPGPGVPPEPLRRHARHRGHHRAQPGPPRMDERGLVTRRHEAGRHRQRGSGGRPRRRHAARGRRRGPPP